MTANDNSKPEYYITWRKTQAAKLPVMVEKNQGKLFCEHGVENY